MVRITTYDADPGAELLAGQQWSHAFFSSDIDKRGEAAVAWAKSRATTAEFVRFDVVNAQLQNTAGSLWARDLVHRCRGASSLMLEATTLGVVEILLLLKAAREAGIEQVDLLYLEPVEYQRSDNSPLMWGREFSLSNSHNFGAVKGFAVEISTIRRGQIVAFLGYEGARLKQALGQLEIGKEWTIYAVFGVPGYEPGWEINALANNVNTLTAQIEARFLAAASVTSAYKLLSDIHQSADWQESPTIVLPLGTKPHSIASCIFLCENASYQRSGLTFDHPSRSSRRSDDIRKWHLYRVRF